MWISPFVQDYHLLVTSSVKGKDGLLFSVTWPLPASSPAHQALKLQVDLSLSLSQQISQCRLEAPSRSSARAVGRPTASGESLSSRSMAFRNQEAIPEQRYGRR